MLPGERDREPEQFGREVLSFGLVSWSSTPP
jgi:hypothetical protein